MVKERRSKTFPSLRTWTWCRNFLWGVEPHCLVVRSFQMAALQALCVCVCLRTCVWGPCVCVPSVLGNIFVTISPSWWSLPALRGRKEVGGFGTAETFWSHLAFSRKTRRKPFRKNCLVYRNLKICHYDFFLLILFKSCIWSRQSSLCDSCNSLAVKSACGTLVHVVLLWA